MTAGLASAGFSSIQRIVAMRVIIGRMAHPVSELWTWRWLRNNSTAGELLDTDFDGGSSLHYDTGLPGASGIASSFEKAWYTFELVCSA